MSGTEITTAFKAMQTDIQVSMDDVVSAFVSQYENNLYARKKELSSAIKAEEKHLADFIDDLHTRINGKDLIPKTMPLGLVAIIDNGSIHWDKANNKATMEFKITIKPKNKSSYYGNTINIDEEKKIPAADVRAYSKQTQVINDLRADLSEVLVALKSVTRKERQVRGRIAVRKLEDSGYANLMQDSELAQLVQLDDI